MYVGKHAAKVNKASLETHNHNCSNIRLILSWGFEIFHDMLGWQVQLLTWAVGVSNQLIYSPDPPTMESSGLLYVATNVSFCLLTFFDKCVRCNGQSAADPNKRVKPEKPITCCLHVHSFFEETPLFMVLMAMSILGIIEEDFEKSNKYAKAAALRARRGMTEFQVLNRQRHYRRQMFLKSSIRARKGVLGRQESDHGKTFAHVATPNLIVHACCYHLFANFTDHFNYQDFKVLACKHAFYRVIQVLVRLVRKQGPFKEVMLKSDGDRLAASCVHVPATYPPTSQAQVDSHSVVAPTPAQTAKARQSRTLVKGLLSTVNFKLVRERWAVTRCVYSFRMCE